MVDATVEAATVQAAEDVIKAVLAYPGGLLGYMYPAAAPHNPDPGSYAANARAMYEAAQSFLAKQYLKINP